MNKRSVVECQAVRTQVGLCELSWRSKIEIAGPDRAAFLNNILSQDILKLKAGQSARAALLSAPAKVLLDMEVYAFENSIVLDLESSIASKAIALFEKFQITDDVTFTDISDRFVHISLEGKRAAYLISSFVTVDFPRLLKRQHCSMIIDGTPAVTALYSFFGEQGYQLWLPREKAPALLEKIREAGKKWGLEEISDETFEILRIEAGVLRYGKDMDETVSLPETGLDEIAASDSKGCYPGQEVVARTKTYKGLQRKINGLISSGEEIPRTGDKIWSAEREIGWITSACFSPTLKKTLAFGYLAKGFFDQPTEVEIKKAADGSLKAATLPLPFI